MKTVSKIIEVYENAAGVVCCHNADEGRSNGRKYWEQDKVLSAARSGELEKTLGFNPMQIIAKGEDKGNGVFAKVVVSEVPEEFMNAKEKAAMTKAQTRG